MAGLAGISTRGVHINSLQLVAPAANSVATWMHQRRHEINFKTCSLPEHAHMKENRETRPAIKLKTASVFHLNRRRRSRCFPSRKMLKFCMMMAMAQAISAQKIGSSWTACQKKRERQLSGR